MTQIGVGSTATAQNKRTNGRSPHRVAPMPVEIGSQTTFTKENGGGEEPPSGTSAGQTLSKMTDVPSPTTGRSGINRPPIELNLPDDGGRQRGAFFEGTDLETAAANDGKVQGVAMQQQQQLKDSESKEVKPSNAAALDTPEDKHSTVIDGPTIDWGLALHQQCQGDKDFLEELLGDLWGELEEHIHLLRDAMKHGDMSQVSIEAHTIKGVAGNLMCKRVERAAKVVEAITKSLPTLVIDTPDAAVAERATIQGVEVEKTEGSRDAAVLSTVTKNVHVLEKELTALKEYLEGKQLITT